MTTTLVTGVRVVGRRGAQADRDVLVRDGRIEAVGAAGTTPPPGCTVVDGAGASLLPGFVEGHAHPDGVPALQSYARAGITTVVDMGSRDDSLHRAAEGRTDLPTVIGPGLPATAPGGMQTRTMGFPRASEVRDAADAERFVRDRVAEGARFVKIIVDDPKIPGTRALPPATLRALVDRTHAAGLLAIAHAVTVNAFGIADDAGVDVITHVPVDGVPDEDRLDRVTGRGVVLIPTLTMMDAAARELSSRLLLKVLSAVRIAPALRYSHAEQTVRALAARGARILVGTDANSEPAVPARPGFATTFAEEVERLARAGLSSTDVLWGATGATADLFGLTDRGVVEPDRRADLVLLDGDPTNDLSAVRRVRSVWLAGEPVTP